MTETTVTPAGPLVVEEGDVKPGFIGQSVPRKEDKRLVQGEGVFFDDVKRHEMGYVHFVRSPYAHARIKSVDVAKALELDGVYGTLTGDEVAILTDPFFELSTAPGANIVLVQLRSVLFHFYARFKGRKCFVMVLHAL